MADNEDEQVQRDLQRDYLDFLDDEEDQGVYSRAVLNMINSDQRRLIVNINHLRKKNPKRAHAILNGAFEELIAFQRAVKEMVGSINIGYAKEHEDFYVGLEGSFGAKHVTPRSLTSHYLGNLVCVEGIVIKCSLVRPKVVRSIHYCPATKKTVERRYTDLTSYEAFPSTSVYPTKDEDGNVLETEFGLSKYKDHQTFTIQEMPEKSPPGQLPRSVDVVADDDLVDRCKPGDRVQVVGIYRCLPGKKGGYTSGSFRTILIACNIIGLSNEVSSTLSKEDVARCRRFSMMKTDIFELLSNSLAPSIQGHEYVKKALLCMLLGGVEKVLPNGTRLRGDINVLVIGDPSMAKSQLLRYILHSAPRAIATTGRGSSGVGLTAAVTTDHETSERRLEAGAMVLADRGVVCIDEFDKMSDIDRTAIHEVMEQGKVTIAKAGIHARLNARCSVLAAANPVYGKYDQYRTPMENIGMQDSLLSRFDLLFIVLDIVDLDQDRLISDHVVRMHQYRAPNEQDGEALPMDSTANLLTTNDPDLAERQSDTRIYEKYNALLHGNLRSRKDKIVSMNFMKKYITLAKSIKPTLTQDASTSIAEEYSRLRCQDIANTDLARTQPITARTLETLIRLSTAHAKARLSTTVDVEDTLAAIELVQFAYFKKVMEKKKRARKTQDSDDDKFICDDEDEVDAPQRKKTKESLATPLKPGDEGYDPFAFTESEEMDVDSSVSLGRTSTQVETETETPVAESMADAVISDERLKVFKASMLKLFATQHAQSMPIDRVTTFVNEQNDQNPFDTAEVNAALARMTDANQVMVSDDIVFLI